MASERELAEIQHKAIEKANQQKNPFATIVEDCGTYERDELKIEIKFFHSKEMTKDLNKFCFKLAERNVSSYYKTCHLGWQPKVKQTALAKSWAKFLIAYHNKKPIGFTQFRFDMDYGRSCVYCYELQIEDGYKNKGLGEHLMKTLEKLAKIWSMEKVVLTLLTNNEGAKRFYKRIGYTLDDTSPSDETAYEIHSKEI